MQEIQRVALFLVGVAFALVWFSVVILPLVCGFTRSLYWWFKGWVRLSAPLRYLWVSTAWFFGIFGLLFFLAFKVPVLRPYLLSDSLITGQEAGLVLWAAKAIFVKSARADIDADFLDFIRPHLTAAGLGEMEKKLS